MYLDRPVSANKKYQELYHMNENHKDGKSKEDDYNKIQTANDKQMNVNGSKTPQF